MNMSNIDRKVVDAFGDEWRKFDQSALPEQDRESMFNAYFAIFPWKKLPPDAIGFDLGCGSGRWATRVAPRVGQLHCIDASSAALEVARRNLRQFPNCRFHLASVDQMPVPDEGCDFGYALGVLHHLPDTKAAMHSCAAKLKPGAPLLVYLYYAFDNRPGWFRRLWKLTEWMRLVISRLPFRVRYAISQGLAAVIYWPLARLAAMAEYAGLPVDLMPLSFYRKRSFYVMRTDALDRFGTRLEKRFTRTQIQEMMESVGLENVRFHDGAPYWCALGFKK
jgi:ubiquinone/menaquinone biosynthesis C-methylase UbiE